MTIKDLLIKGKIESRDEYEMFMACASIEVDEQVDYKILDARIIFSNECFCEIYVSEDPEDESEYIQNIRFYSKDEADIKGGYCAIANVNNGYELNAGDTYSVDEFYDMMSEEYQEKISIEEMFKNGYAVDQLDVEFDVDNEARTLTITNIRGPFYYDAKETSYVLI